MVIAVQVGKKEGLVKMVASKEFREAKLIRLGQQLAMATGVVIAREAVRVALKEVRSVDRIDTARIKHPRVEIANP